MKTPRIITLTSDFGHSDPYVAMMKGVILSINPEAHLVDITHQIKSGDIQHGARLIQETCKYFPKRTIHIGVVDPGVGGDRRPLLICVGDYFFVGPDNGLFWPTIQSCAHAEVIHLTEKTFFLPHISPTFHGRDIFAPVAAHLSCGINPEKMGKIIEDPIQLLLPTPEYNGNSLFGRITRVDNFGNLVTNINRKDLEQLSGKKGRITLQIGDVQINEMRKTFSEVKKGDFLAFVGSSEWIEIAVNMGRACDQLGLNPDEAVGMKVKISMAVS